MKVLVTGANGFLGKAVCQSALNAGLDVAALVRPASRMVELSSDSANFEIRRGDLRDKSCLDQALDGIDAVIHLAAAKAGDFHAQFATTVVATENLLAAMNMAGVSNLVGISSFSVFEYTDAKKKSLLDEESAVIANPAKRDDYARTKLEQEKLFVTFGEEAGNDVAILRPGMIYGAGELWHPLLGSPMGPRFVRIGSKSTLPLTYVENCADAIVCAAQACSNSSVSGQVFNIVDDDLPTQDGYVEALGKYQDNPKSVTVPWNLWRMGASALQVGNKRLLSSNGKFPGLFDSAKLDARFKPLTYTNSKAKRLLNWEPKFDLDDALQRSIEIEKEVFVV